MIEEITTSAHSREVSRGERFEFGKNWSRFLACLDDARIASAEQHLLKMLEVENLEGKRFLDIGSGSGLFSLAARRLGASVYSFDYDPQSAACTSELKRRYFPDDELWRIEEGSALDEHYMRSLGQFDVVYSWGVLHHTGQMWKALENAQLPVAPGGTLFIAIYNDTGSQSARWRWVKKTYNDLPSFFRAPFAILVSTPSEAKTFLRSLIRLRPVDYVRLWTKSNGRRGMSRWHDLIDWVGGYPYEVEKREEIFDFYKARGFRLTRLRCGGVGLGCNEFVFLKETNNLKETDD